MADGVLQVRRSAGRLRNLEAVLRERPLDGPLGIGHTRWATHGRPSEENAHPHTDCTGSIVVVHNGILENYLPIKARLQAEGHVFKSETDTEVLAHLVEQHWAEAGGLAEAVRRALPEVRGAYAVGVVSDREPGALVAAKTGAGGVVVGLGDGEYFVASDVPAILAHTRDVLILEDGEMAVVTRAGRAAPTLAGRPVERPVTHITWDPIMAEKGGYRHFMLKEIYEQPRAITDTFRGRISPETGDCFLPDLNLTRRRAAGVRAGGAGGLRHVVPRGARRAPDDRAAGRRSRRSGHRLGVPVPGPADRPRHARRGALASRARRRTPSAPCRPPRPRARAVVAMCNAVGSALAREAHGVLYIHAGPGDQRRVDEDLHRDGDAPSTFWPSTWGASAARCRRRPASAGS